MINFEIIFTFSIIIGVYFALRDHKNSIKKLDSFEKHKSSYKEINAQLDCILEKGVHCEYLVLLLDALILSLTHISKICDLKIREDNQITKQIIEQVSSNDNPVIKSKSRVSYE